jgi:hypothetical protein
VAVVFLYLATCIYVRTKRQDAFDSVNIGDTADSVVARFGNPSVREGPEKLFSRYVRPVALRGDATGVRPLEASFQAALAKLRELSQPFSGPRPANVVDAGGGLIRLTPTDDALAEREQQIIDGLMPVVKARMNNMGLHGTVEQKGARRIAIQAPGIGDPQRPLLLAKILVE